MIPEVLQLIEEYKLGDTMRWILENNPSQALPYHNFNHSLWVMYNAAENWRCERPDCNRVSVELLTAALFHDFGHSGGFFDNDGGNIELAVAGYKRMVKDYSHYVRMGMVELVPELIRATRYPLVGCMDINYLTAIGTPETYATCCMQCLCDADMMQNCNDTLLANFVGIKQELFRHLDYKEYCQKSIDFLKTIKYETKRGIEVGKPQLDKAIEQLEMFQRLCF